MAHKKTRADLHAHARKRAEERYGLKFTKSIRIQAVKDIQEGKALFIAKESNVRTRWNIVIGGTNYPIVYDNKRHAIVTFLSAGVVERQTQKPQTLPPSA
jgi:hypothetical protein